MLIESRKQSWEAIAKRGAAKICGIGDCAYAFACGHANKSTHLVPRIGTEDKCPLARYGVEPDTDPRPWWERDASETSVSEDEIFALCACCPHGEVDCDKDGMPYVRRVHFYDACLDCPVKAAEEAIQENRAES